MLEATSNQITKDAFAAARAERSAAFMAVFSWIFRKPTDVLSEVEFRTTPAASVS